MMENLNAHSFEQKVERGGSRVTWGVNRIYIFLLSNLIGANWLVYKYMH
jgi:hypothetical protein